MSCQVSLKLTFDKYENRENTEISEERHCVDNSSNINNSNTETHSNNLCRETTVNSEELSTNFTSKSKNGNADDNDSTLRIGCLNIDCAAKGSFFGKIYDIIDKMTENQLDILGLTETDVKKERLEKFCLKNHTIFQPKTDKTARTIIIIQHCDIQLVCYIYVWRPFTFLQSMKT